MNNYIEIFSNFFEKGGWRGEGGESFSGIGSSLAYTENYRNNLLKIIKKYNIENIFDCSCGDWNWMKEITEHLPNYVGNDVVKSLIEKNNKLYGKNNISFVFGDMITTLEKYEDKKFDLIICRHTFEHLPEEYCINAINEFKRVCKYAIITTNNSLNVSNADISKVANGNSRGIHLHLSPYNQLLNSPIESFYDSIGQPQTYGCFGNLYKF